MSTTGRCLRHGYIISQCCSLWMPAPRKTFLTDAMRKALQPQPKIAVTVGRRAALRAVMAILYEVGMAGSGRDRTITWEVGEDEPRR